MFNSREKLSELGATLWNLKETIGELRASCEQLASAVEKQELRLRALEEAAISIKADIRVSAAESREAAGDKAVSVASTLVGNANGEIFSRLNELQSKLNALVDIDYPKNSRKSSISPGKSGQKLSIGSE